MPNSKKKNTIDHRVKKNRHEAEKQSEKRKEKNSKRPEQTYMKGVGWIR